MCSKSAGVSGQRLMRLVCEKSNEEFMDMLIVARFCHNNNMQDEFVLFDFFNNVVQIFIGMA